MGRRKRDGNHSPPKIIQYRIQKEMKKADTQFRTPTKQRQTVEGTQQCPQEQL
jgi:hypothetical protein